MNVSVILDIIAPNKTYRYSGEDGIYSQRKANTYDGNNPYSENLIIPFKNDANTSEEYDNVSRLYDGAIKSIGLIKHSLDVIASKLSVSSL